MRITHLVLATVLCASVAYAQEPRQRRPPDSSQGGSSQGSGQAEPRRAVPREEPPPPPPPPPPAATAPAPRANAPSRGTAGDDGQRTAQPRQRRPPTDDGRVAVPRGSVPRPGTVDVPRVYNNYYYYPRRYYPYGYGAFGLGYFYYDPYSWYPYDYGSYRFGGYGYGYPTGELRLRVRPRNAEVYVDGYYAGRVDEFDGMFQALELESGGYTIEIVAPGFEPLQFDVRIQPGRKTTYDGDLRPLRP
jgi:hypothetical protein